MVVWISDNLNDFNIQHVVNKKGKFTQTFVDKK